MRVHALLGGCLDALCLQVPRPTPSPASSRSRPRPSRCGRLRVLDTGSTTANSLTKADDRRPTSRRLHRVHRLHASTASNAHDADPAARAHPADHLVLRQDPRRRRSGPASSSCGFVRRSRSALGHRRAHELALVIGFLPRHSTAPDRCSRSATAAGATQADCCCARGSALDGFRCALHRTGDLARLGSGVLVGVVLTLAIVVPLGWMWWNSLLPSSYSVMDMGYADYGGGPHPGQARHGRHGGDGAHGSSGVSVTSLDTPKGGAPDVVVDLTARQGTVKLASGKTVEGYTHQRHLAGTRRSRPPSASWSRCTCTTTTSRAASRCTGTVSTCPTREDGVAGVTQNAVKPGKDYTYRWVAPHAGTYWYHSHQMSARAGLAAACSAAS